MHEEDSYVAYQAILIAREKKTTFSSLTFPYMYAWSVDDGTICFDGYWREAPCESTIKRNYKRFIKLIVKVCVLKVSRPTCFRLLRQQECSNSDNYDIKLNEWDELACSVEANGNCASLHVTSTNGWWRRMQWIHNHDRIVAFLALQMSTFFCSATIIKFPVINFPISVASSGTIDCLRSIKSFQFIIQSQENERRKLIEKKNIIWSIFVLVWVGKYKAATFRFLSIESGSEYGESRKLGRKSSNEKWRIFNFQVENLLWKFLFKIAAKDFSSSIESH